MSTSVLLLILVSTFFHAGWNLLFKHDGTGGAFIRRLLTVICVLGAIPSLLAEIFVGPLLIHIWMYLAVSGGVCCSLYLVGLIRAYGSSDFTIAYPVSRALPVLAITLAELPLGRLPTPGGWLGLMMVMIGCLMAPMTTLRDFRPATWFNRPMLWILLAAMGTVGYTLIDDLGAARMVELELDSGLSAMRYCYYYFTASLIGLLLISRATQSDRANAKAIGWLRPTVAGVMCLSSYGLILWAYQLTDHTSYVIAGRQLSIVIGVVLAFVVFGEPGRVIRFAAALLITAGVVAIRLGG